MSEMDTKASAPTENRRPWQPLGYDKIAAADAESGFTGIGLDNTFYS